MGQSFALGAEVPSWHLSLGKAWSGMGFSLVHIWGVGTQP